MPLLLDVGNTSVTYGIYHGGRLHSFGSCLHDDIPKLVRNCSVSGVFSPNGHVVISSVVPQLLKKLRKSLPKKTKIQVLEAGRNLPVPVKHKYRGKTKPGIDRLVNIYGAVRIYDTPLLMIDFGTAITFDYVSKSGTFEGGMIVPGPEIAFQALLSRAALIPKSLRLPKKSSRFLGKTTYEGIASGVLEGYGALTDGLIERFRNRYGKTMQVIATGGFVPNLKRHATAIKIWDPRHSIKSLLLLYKSHQHPS